MIYPDAKPVGSGLYIVATPIGNLRDLTLRALDVLSACDLVLCEDTRVTAKLMSAYGLKKQLKRCDEFAEAARIDDVLERLSKGEIIVLVSDAGTPLISDPGFALVRAVSQAGQNIIPIPGASSVLAALSVSGLATDRFLFAGFTPAKSSQRRGFYTDISTIEASLVVFETGPRLRASLLDLVETLGDRDIAICRELTKRYEQIYRGPASMWLKDERLDAPKGEIVIVISAPEVIEVTQDHIETALRQAVAQYGPSEAAKQVAKLFGLSKSELYGRALALKVTPE